MNPETNPSLDQLRARSAYGGYRNLIGPISMIGMVFAAVGALGTLRLMWNTWSMTSFFESVSIVFMGLLTAALTYFVSVFFKEAAHLAADVADAALEKRAREDKPAA